MARRKEFSPTKVDPLPMLHICSYHTLYRNMRSLTPPPYPSVGGSVASVIGFFLSPATRSITVGLNLALVKIFASVVLNQT